MKSTPISIAVAGGNGTIGKQAVRAARARGHHVTVLSRHDGVDVHTGTGLVEALRGADAVLDLTSVAAFSTEDSMAFFPVVTRNLLAAQREAEVRHFVNLGIVGATIIDDGYYAGKAESERILADAPHGWSLLYATQFHEFVAQMAHAGEQDDVQLSPEVRFRPVAASEVAEALIDLAERSPHGFGAQLAGPQEEDMPTLMAKWIRAHGSNLPVRSYPMPGRFGEGLRDGSILPAADATLGRITFDEWLTAEPDVGAFAE